MMSGDAGTSAVDAGVGLRKGSSMTIDASDAMQVQEQEQADMREQAQAAMRAGHAGDGAAKDAFLAEDLFRAACAASSERRFEDAVALFERASEAGDARATHRLGVCRAFGRGVGRDEGRARELLDRAARSGVVDAHYDLAVLIVGMVERSRARRAATAGGSAAGLREGFCECEGRIDVETPEAMDAVLDTPYDEAEEADLRLAMRHLEAAAGKGHVKACLELARRYDAGRGVPRDPARATGLLERAVESGDREVLLELAHRLLTGEGAKRDIDHALMLYRVAEMFDARTRCTYLSAAPHSPAAVRRVAELRDECDAGGRPDVDALHLLGGCYEFGWGVERDFEKAAGLYRRAADEGMAWAMRDLAVLCALGRGTVADLDLARYYIELAQHGDDRRVGPPWKRSARLAGVFDRDLIAPLVAARDAAREHALGVACQQRWEGKRLDRYSLCFRYGIGVGQSFEKAWMCQRLKEQNLYKAVYDPASALELPEWANDGLEDRIRATDLQPSRQFEILAMFYEHGWGVPRDTEKAGLLYAMAPWRVDSFLAIDEMCDEVGAPEPAASPEPAGAPESAALLEGLELYGFDDTDLVWEDRLSRIAQQQGDGAFGARLLGTLAYSWLRPEVYRRMCLALGEGGGDSEKGAARDPRIAAVLDANDRFDQMEWDVWSLCERDVLDGTYAGQLEHEAALGLPGPGDFDGDPHRLRALADLVEQAWTGEYARAVLLDKLGAQQDLVDDLVGEAHELAAGLRRRAGAAEAASVGSPVGPAAGVCGGAAACDAPEA